MICNITVGSLENGSSRNRTFNYVNRDYLGSIAVKPPVTPTPEDNPQVQGNYLPVGYDTFWDWVAAIGRGINSLSLNTYIGTSVTASWDTNEALGG